MTSPRALFSMVLLLGLLAGQGGRGSMAFFTSTVVSDANAFSGGVVDIAGTLGATGSTASILTTNVFSWTTNGASGTGNISSSATCANILTGTDVRDQRMAPGHYCVAPIDINNNNTNAVDAWMRIRAVRATPYQATGNAQVDVATEALNDRLKLYMHEYAGAGSAAINKAARDADCNTNRYKLTYGAALGPLQANSGSGTNFSEIYGSSGGKILNGPVAGFPGVSRTALSTLEEIGKNLGAHAGISALTVPSSTHAFDAAQDTVVLGLREAKQGATVGADADSTANTAPANNNGLRLKAGTSAPNSGTAGVPPAEANMFTALGSTPSPSTTTVAPGARNAYNLAGTDGVTNPVQLDADVTSRSSAPLSITGALVSPQLSGGNTANAGTTQTVTFSFTLGAGATWRPDGQVAVVFPAGYNVSGAAAGALTVAVGGTAGGLGVSINGQTVIVRRDGSGSDLTPANGLLSFTLNNVGYPSLPIDTQGANAGFPSLTAAAAYNTISFTVLSPLPTTTGGAASANVAGSSVTRTDASSRGTNREAEINKGERRFYCMAIFLPSDTDVNFPVVYADAGDVGFAVGLGATFNGTYDYAAGQYPAGGTTLGAGNAALTAANGKGDSAIGGGDVRYYLTITAAQKAGRTVN